MLVNLLSVLALLTAADAPPNVVLLSVDTLRADRLGCYGYALDTSPNLDALAEKSLLFEDCVCEVPLTSPSMVSMLCSRYPRMTGVTRNGLPLPRGVPTVPERFKQAGYQTFCVQSNWTLKDKLSGLARGFDIYDDGFNKKRWGFIKAERDADEVTARALRLLDKRDKDKPFFAWFHYTDPHAPYNMHKKHNPSGKRAWLLKNVEKVRVKYDSEVAFTDAWIGPLLEALPENTALLFVGDHGESLYEHGYLGHGRRIYQHEMRIPLFIHAPNVKPGRSKAPARGIDIGPTLLGLAGIAPVAGMLGTDLLAAPPAPDRVRVVETYGGAVPKLPGAKTLMADAPPMRQGVLLEGWKLIINGRKRELYDLSTDPDELENLAAGDKERVAALEALIKAWDEATGHGDVLEEHLSAEDRRALDALGYLE